LNFIEEEMVGFEPTEVLPSPVFKTGAIVHSATSPSEPFGSLLILTNGRPYLFQANFYGGTRPGVLCIGSQGSCA
jgi:hypothetical protein